MAYDTSLEQRIDTLIAPWPDIEKKKMFGGVCYLTRGNMCFGIWQGFLIVRSDPATSQAQLQREHVRPFDGTGKPMKGWLTVAGQGWPSDASLKEWLAIGRDYALTLPEK